MTFHKNFCDAVQHIINAVQYVKRQITGRRLQSQAGRGVAEKHQRSANRAMWRDVQAQAAIHL